jgi:hypothetical protein
MIDKNPKPNKLNRVLIATPTTGLVRMEFVQSRYTQTIPTNWSEVDYTQWYNTYTPIGYQINDAENLIAKIVVEQNFEWLFFLEHDNVIPPGTFIKMNEYMVEGKIPVVAALYFTKSDPPEPMVYKEFGHGYFDKWKLGDKVWVKGCPFGCTLIHGSLIRELWKTAPEYMVGNQLTRRVFHGPENDPTPNVNGYFINKGTSDLAFCKEIVEKKILEKAGWPDFQKKKYPILVDTSIFVKHIDQDGVQWPVYVPKKYAPKGMIT